MNETDGGDAARGPALDAAEWGRLRWRCRRGMKELDLLLTRYVDGEYEQAAAADRRAFLALLESQDTEIYAYLLGRAEPPTVAMRAVVDRLLAGRDPA